MGTPTIGSIRAGIGRVLLLLVLAPSISLLGPSSPALSEVKAADQPAVAAPETSIDQSTENSFPVPAEQTAADSSPDEVEQWAVAMENIKADIQTGRREPEAADQFYLELNEALRIKRQQLHRALDSRPPPLPDEQQALATPDTEPKKIETVPPHDGEAGGQFFAGIEQLKYDMDRLYELRVAALSIVTADFRTRILGTGLVGVRSLKDEIDFLILDLRYRSNTLPQRGKQLTERFFSAPLPFFFKAVKLTILILLFVIWRRWSFAGLPKLRTNLLATRPRKQIHVRLARFIWYVNRVRLPVEIFIFLTVAMNILDLRQNLLFSLLLTKGQYILMAWFAVALINALADKRLARLDPASARLRLRTVWVIAVWVLVTGLMVDIAEDFTGKATMHSWAWMVGYFLVFPLFGVLLHWWRPEIYEELENYPQPTPLSEKILQHRTGIEGYLWSALGAALLLIDGVRQIALQTVTATEGGRSFIANLSRMEALRASERRKKITSGEPISAHLRELLYEGDDRLVESAGHEALEKMVGLARRGQQGEALIVAERGGGKSQLFARLEQRLEDKMVLLDCPPGGGKALVKEFASALELEATELSPETVTNRIKEGRVSAVGIDNFHRLARPAMGGQQEIDEMIALIRRVKAEVFWFLGFDWAAWQYISRVRANRLFVEEIIHLPLWSEAQIEELIEQRCNHAGIEPDFSELILPRHFEDSSFDTLEEQNRNGFFRILWNASDGNPVVALQLWMECIRVAEDGSVLVSLPKLPSTADFDDASITVLLILRVIAQSGYASLQEIVESLRFPEPDVAGALRLAESHEWIEYVDGRYRLSWKWFRTVTRVLARQNLLVRRTLVV